MSERQHKNYQQTLQYDSKIGRQSLLGQLVWCPIFNTLRQRQDSWHFADDIFNCIFLNKNVLISIKILLKSVPKGPVNNIPALVQIMAWRRPGDKPLSEPMMVSLPTHVCVTRLQWVKASHRNSFEGDEIYWHPIFKWVVDSTTLQGTRRVTPAIAVRWPALSQTDNETG